MEFCLDKHLVWHLAPASVFAALINPSQLLAHGFAGQRFFPATIQTDDPFVADEMSLPSLTLNPKGQTGRARAMSASIWPNASRVISG